MKQCAWKRAYESTLEREMKMAEVQEKGTESFRDFGCDKCNGNDMSCASYVARNVIKREATWTGE